MRKLYKYVLFLNVMSLEDKARLLITMKCNRQCAGCCNTYYNIMSDARHIDSLTDLPDELGSIMITGGEPMLFPQKTQRIAEELRNRYPLSRLYLYSATYDDNLENIIPLLDGFHYTIHKEANNNDLILLDKLQELLQRHQEDWRDKSFRLYVDDKVNLSVRIVSDVWTQANISKWLTEEELLEKQPGGLPAKEKLYIYTGN
jgi:organic radical activating enzyme